MREAGALSLWVVARLPPERAAPVFSGRRPTALSDEPLTIEPLTRREAATRQPGCLEPVTQVPAEGCAVNLADGKSLLGAHSCTNARHTDHAGHHWPRQLCARAHARC